MAEADDTTDGTDRHGGSVPAPGDDERELLDSFDRLAPEGSIQWGFDDAMRRLSSADERGTWVEPWHGLPADLWDRGRGARAGERMLGDVITALAQELTEYSQRIVDDVRRTVPNDTAVFDALRYLVARVERLEASVDPLGLRPADLDLPEPDASGWAGAVPGWIEGTGGRPVVVGELVTGAILEAVASTGADVDAVDPRVARTWELRQAPPGRPGQVQVTSADVAEHLGRLPAAERSAVVLSGCIDRSSLADRVAVVTAAVRALVPGGALVVLAADQEAWDEALEPAERDLLPGRPFHPDTWRVVLARLGLADPVAHRDPGSSVHAVVARRPR